MPDPARPLPVSTSTAKLRPEEAGLFLWAIIPYFTLKWSTFFKLVSIIQTVDA